MESYLGYIRIADPDTNEVEMEIQALRALVEQALEDKILTRAELDAIAEGISADGIVSEEEEEIIRSIQEKIKNREIQIVDRAE